MNLHKSLLSLILPIFSFKHIFVSAFKEINSNKIGVCGSALPFIQNTDNVLPDGENYPYKNYKGIYHKFRKSGRSYVRIHCLPPKKKLGAGNKDIKAYREWKKERPSRKEKSGRYVCNKNGQWVVDRMPPVCGSPSTMDDWNYLINGNPNDQSNQDGPTNPFSLLIPAYVYPKSNGQMAQAYKTLNESAHLYPDIEHVIVLNPNNGYQAINPPNIDWAPVIDMFVETNKITNNIKLIGYVSTLYGNLDSAHEQTVKDQITGYYNDWSCTGVFYDETQGVGSNEQSQTLAMYQRYVDHANSLNDQSYTVFNFGSQNMIDGTEYDENWMTVATINIMLEQTKSYYENDWSTSAAQMNLPKESMNII